MEIGRVYVPADDIKPKTTSSSALKIDFEKLSLDSRPVDGSTEKNQSSLARAKRSLSGHLQPEANVH